MSTAAHGGSATSGTAVGYLRARAGNWPLGAAAAAALTGLPIVAIVWLALNPTDNIWPHLARTVLPRYALDTVLLMAGVGVLASSIGVGSAWFITMCRFPGRKIFEWALFLPLAMPTYLIAYTYVDLMEFAGPVQEMLRSATGWQTRQDYWFPEIRSLGGAIFILAFVLYPYTYLTARAAFIQQSVCVVEVSRTLGCSPTESFVRVGLPLARPAVVAGAVLIMMECMNDVGAVEHFGVHTLTVGIFNIWLERGNLGGAAQIAIVMLVFVVVLVLLERSARAGRRYHSTSTRYRSLPGYELSGFQAAAAVIGCAIPIVVGFVVPAAILLRYAILTGPESFTTGFFTFAGNSFLLSGVAATIAACAGLLLAYAVRLARQPAVQGAARIASLGYAVPGAVLGLGILIPLAAFDNQVDAIMRSVFGISTGLMLTGGIVALVYAYLVRFMALSFGTIDAGLTRVTPTMDMAARSLGETAWSTLRRVHIPLLRPAVLTATLLVFVDCMKELPATLILRPFNFDTLATHVYTYASLGLLEESAAAGLAIVVVGLAPVVLLTRAISHGRPGHHTQV